MQIKSIITYSRELWEKYTIYTTNYSGNGRYVAFRITDQSGFNRLSLDNIQIKLNLSCRTSENLTCVRISDNQAKISWSDVLGSYDYAMKISTRNIDPEYAEADVDAITGIFNAFETIYGLALNLYFFYYVKGTGVSEVSYLT